MTNSYKLSTIVLAGILIVTYAFHWQDIFGHSSKPMAMQGMHTMPDGTMMMNDGAQVQGSMSSMMMDMTANLKDKSGDALDKAFLEDMVVHHQGAVDMSKELLKRTQRPELIQFANDIISLQTKEIQMQKAWLQKWFGGR